MTRYFVDNEVARWRMVDGEVVLLHAETSYYYNLNSSGSYLWQLLTEKGRSQADLVAALAERHEIEESTVALDVETLLGDLLREGLVKAESESK